MDNTLFLASVVGPYYLVIGLSFLMYATSWKKIVADWEKNHYALVTAGCLSLIFGLLIIQVHNIWAWNLWVVITLTGWIALFKGIFLFLTPGSWTKVMFKLVKKPAMIYIGGLLFAVLGGWMSYLVYLA
ncbi:hypothetical protein JXA05_03980 [Candidatus Peregrinibacteria bacterium]|nr:hypothetical protein [Candidatus Peregrinibacteria bacterium]